MNVWTNSDLVDLRKFSSEMVNLSKMKVELKSSETHKFTHIGLLLYIYWLFLLWFYFANFASQSPQKFPLQLWLFKHHKNREIKPSQISPPSPKLRKYL